MIFNKTSTTDSHWKLRSIDPLIGFQIQNLDSWNPGAAVAADDSNRQSGFILPEKVQTIKNGQKQVVVNFQLDAG